VNTLENQLRRWSREAALQFLSGLIFELTIRGRYFYDEPDSHRQMVVTNEAIHRIAGHLRDLQDTRVDMTPSRAEGIAAAATLLAPDLVEKLIQRLPA
jgi:hypothetical protein